MLKCTKESLPLKYTGTHEDLHSCNRVTKLGPCGRLNMTDRLCINFWGEDLKLLLLILFLWCVFWADLSMCYTVAENFSCLNTTTTAPGQPG